MTLSCNRSYRHAQPFSAGDGAYWVVMLDEQPLRTPVGEVLQLPNGALAEAVAEEWDGQGEFIQPSTLPLTALANVAQDRVSGAMAVVAADLAAFAETDLLCYRAATPASLALLQAEQWQPLLDWAALRFDAVLLSSEGVMPLPQPEASLKAIRRAVDAQDAFRLTALRQIAGACGSLILALAVLEHRCEPDSAATLAEIDEAFQNERWGTLPEAITRRARAREDIATAAKLLDLLAAL